MHKLNGVVVSIIDQAGCVAGWGKKIKIKNCNVMPRTWTRPGTNPISHSILDASIADILMDE